MDRSLDEILADRQRKTGGSRGNRDRGGSRRRDRQEQPRDGVRKSYRDDAPRNLDTEWVHDRFEDNGSTRPRQQRRRRDEQDESGETKGTKIRVDNVHYELTVEDLEGLFSRIGTVLKVDIRYDRAGRSEGTAYVTYEAHSDALKAIREFDGANAAGQPIRMSIVPTAPRRNPFDTAVMPGRPLAERITLPTGRSDRSLSPEGDAARRGIDRYVPGGRKGRSRSPPPRRREGGRRPGARREGRGAGGAGGAGGRRDNAERTGRERRPKKTQEELDAEMEDYFGGGGGGGGGGGEAHVAAEPAATNGSGAAAPAAHVDDVDMIE
ncbi:THO complex subunit 4A [Pleurostoma richardsiae]|uniref:THO complex subunit 4A n=1 Tax=Pleurostoma richardsiae TaxID=41990 RepID=A0AA38RLK6_9PEZI|nr:THO complex subunit 4A [Pleurostoma richardsiae]